MPLKAFTSDHLPLQPAERMNDWLNASDIHLLPQKAGAADLVLSSKLLGILASGRPVVASSTLEANFLRSLQKLVRVLNLAMPKPLLMPCVV